MTANAYDQAQRYISHRDKLVFKSLNTAVFESLNESKRYNRDIMDRLSN